MDEHLSVAQKGLFSFVLRETLEQVGVHLLLASVTFVFCTSTAPHGESNAIVRASRQVKRNNFMARMIQFGGNGFLAIFAPLFTSCIESSGDEKYFFVL